MKRLHVVVEGHGDVEAMPVLALRVLRHLGRSWIVNKTSSRLPRGELVNARAPERGRPIPRGLDRAIGFALTARADALLLVVDADDDCPGRFCPSALEHVGTRIPTAAVMAVREFEAWLAPALLEGSDFERKRDAKALIRRVLPNYKPTVHQAHLAKRVDINVLVERGSRSFRKLVSELDRVTR